MIRGDELSLFLCHERQDNNLNKEKAFHSLLLLCAMLQFYILSYSIIFMVTN